MRRIIYCSSRVPEWIIRAAGFEPEMYLPGKTIPDGPVPDAEGVCPFARMFVNDACQRNDVAGMVFTTECDQMRRSAELAGSIKPVFLMNVPATVTDHALELYADEVERLAVFLAVEPGGQRPTVERLSTALQAGLAESVCAGEGTGKVKVMLLGGHVCVPEQDIRRLLADYGLEVAVGILSPWSCGFKEHPVHSDDSESIMRTTAKRRFKAGCDIHQRPNEEFHSIVKRTLDELRPDGVVLLRQTWCDRWFLEMLRFRETLGIPVLDMELNGPSIDARAVCRVQAFAESLAR